MNLKYKDEVSRRERKWGATYDELRFEVENIKERKGRREYFGKWGCRGMEEGSKVRSKEQEE